MAYKVIIGRYYCENCKSWYFLHHTGYILETCPCCGFVYKEGNKKFSSGNK